MGSRIFLSIVFGFLVGVLLSSFYTLGLATVGLVSLIGATFLVSSILNKDVRRAFILISIFFLCSSAGILRFYAKDIDEPKNTLDNFVNESVVLEGVIDSEVERREGSQRIVLSADSITFRDVGYPIDQKILVSTELFPEFSYGERVSVSGKLEKPENFITDIGKEFDYVNYLKKESISFTTSFARVESLGEGYGSGFKTSILSIKKKFLGSIERSIPAPESALLSGLLLGVKSSLGDKLHQDFVNTGLVHIIVLSGYNVTIIAEALIKMLSFASISAGIYFGSLAIIIFAIMTGAGATIVRASIMAILALVARATGRNYEITRALLIAGVIMIIQNPYILVFDISFQLSFLATLGLIYVSPIFQKWFHFLPEKFGIREVAGATVGVQVFVLPFILYKMGNLSLIAPITNVLVLPFIPATMLLGFLAGAVSFILPVLGLPFAWATYMLLHGEIWLVETFSRIPFGSIEIMRFPLVLVILFYAVITWLLYRYYRKIERPLI
jgi:competence protein ComEC